jgi:Zn finger protein HypA/HybF involved in hydrogenase expression
VETSFTTLKKNKRTLTNMDKEKEQALYDKYPDFFCQRNLSPQETCMCWGIAIGNGWYDIIDNMCNKLMQYQRSVPKLKRIEATQVKEKFGTLRVYTNINDDAIDAIIEEAERASCITCETCGKPGHMNKGPWLRVQCDTCESARKKKSAL